MTGRIRPEDYQFVSKNFYEAHLEELVARRLISPDPNVPRGAQEAKRWNYTMPAEDAELIPKGGDYPKMQGSITPTTVPIHKFGIAIDIDEWDLESSQSMGQYAIDKKAVQDMARKLAEKEDSYIFNGNSKVGVTGLYDAATNSFGCVNKWDTSSGEPYEDVNAAAGALEADDFTPKFLVMNNQDMFLLRQEDTYGNVYKEKILKNLGIREENILKTSTLTKGTAILCDAGPKVSELKIPEDVVVLPPETRGDVTTIRARLKLGLDIYETDAYCKITNIS